MRSHGHTAINVGRGTREYHSWCAMRQRCYNQRAAKYPLYGGRGITVCVEWQYSFETFLEDMGPCPLGFSIERINNDDHYYPGNCRWASIIEQANNRRNNRIVEFNRERKTVAQWAALLGMERSALSSRLDRGWTLDMAFDPNASRQGKAKLERVAQIIQERSEKRAEVLVCLECGITFTRRTIRSRCCSRNCEKKYNNRASYWRNRDIINDRRRIKVRSDTQIDGDEFIDGLWGTV